MGTRTLAGIFKCDIYSLLALKSAEEFGRSKSKDSLNKEKVHYMSVECLALWLD